MHSIWAVIHLHTIMTLQKNHLTMETHTMQINSTVPHTIYLAGDHVRGLFYVHKP